MRLSALHRTVRRTGAAAAAVCVAATAALLPVAGAQASTAPAPKPTIVLVHGAWADSSSWAPVAITLQRAGFRVLVAPTSLRSLSGDAAALTSFIEQRTSGPVVLVGHSYGGAVVTDAATSDPRVKALVYVDAFMPDQGESLGSIIGTSASALNVADPTSVFDVSAYPDAPKGDAEVYLKASTFDADFAQDVPSVVRDEFEAAQLPVTLAALGQASSAPAWRTIPSWAVVGTQDRVLPGATQLFMANRAHSHITEVAASHLSMVSHPLQVAAVIEHAAASVN